MELICDWAIDKSGVLTDMDGEVIGRIDGRGALREINPEDGSLGDKITEINGQPYKTGYKFHDGGVRWRDAAPGRGVRGADLAEAIKADEAQAQMAPDTAGGAEAAPDATAGAEAAPDTAGGAEAVPDTTPGAEAAPDTTGGAEAASDIVPSETRYPGLSIESTPEAEKVSLTFNSEHVRGARVLLEKTSRGTAIRMEGGIVGVGQGELIDQGVLKEDFMQTLMEKRPNGLGMSRDIVMSDARNILMYKEAAKALAEAGRQVDADMVLRQVERMKAMVERRYGDVLQ